MVRAKLKLSQITEKKWNPTQEPSRVLRFDTVYDQSIPEDMRFQKATPTGCFEMQVDNPDALAKFELGKDYYVDFTPVPAAV